MVEVIKPALKFLSFRFGNLGFVAGLTVLCAIIPLIYVIGEASSLSSERWLSLWGTRLPQLLGNTLTLAFLVSIASLILGLSSAWLVVRREFPGRKIAEWLLLLPLTIPTYVFAHIYTNLWESDGWLGQIWVAIMPADLPLPDLYNVFGVTIILSLAGFSYIYLLVRGALSQSTRNLEEAARIQGYRSVRIFFKVNLPMLRPALAAGLALIILHTLSDFGAVSMLRYQTFTLSIYTQMSGRMDHQAAAGLSLVLVFLSLTFLVLERFFRQRQRYYSGAQSRRVRRKPASSREKFFIWAWLGSLTFFSFILPVFWMLTWTIDAIFSGTINVDFWRYTINTGIIAFTAATIALILAFPIAFFHVRKHSVMSQAFINLSSVGFVLPGPVIALGVMAFILAQLPLLYGSLFALIIAIVIRFLPLAIQSQEAALQQLTPSIEEAGRTLGAGPIENLRRVTLPIIRNGLASAWVLVFIDTLKELPATLLLRPTGFDTLPVRIWIEASEEMLDLAAPAALVLVIGTLPAIWIMRRGEKFGSN